MVVEYLTHLVKFELDMFHYIQVGVNCFFSQMSGYILITIKIYIIYIYISLCAVINMKTCVSLIFN